MESLCSKHGQEEATPKTQAVAAPHTCSISTPLTLIYSIWTWHPKSLGATKRQHLKVKTAEASETIVHKKPLVYTHCVPGPGCADKNHSVQVFTRGRTETPASKASSGGCCNGGVHSVWRELQHLPWFTVSLPTARRVGRADPTRSSQEAGKPE